MAAAPVAVRIYQLASTATFESADFFQLYQNDQSVLGVLDVQMSMQTLDEAVAAYRQGLQADPNQPRG